jgi:molybdopterin/thiamine biosynthesis adenylyltransferase
MQYSMAIQEQLYDDLRSHLFQQRDVERAGYLLCRLASGPTNIRLLATQFIPVDDADIVSSSRLHMSIRSQSYVRAMKLANEKRSCFVFVHSHPAGVPEHSHQDDVEEVKLFKTAHIRIEGASVHASLVLSSPDHPVGRVWLPNGTHQPINSIRTIGNQIRIFHPPADEAGPDLEIYDRQVRAFGGDLQRILKKLQVGVVGAGGTGSAVCEQLVRLGVGTLLIADGQTLDRSNATRVYGSTLSDHGRPKVDIQREHLEGLGFGTVIRTFDRDVTFQTVLEQFRFCDVIFGCTDDEWGRALLTQFALYYLVPVLDMGVKIDSIGGAIRSIQGRVTMLGPGSPCLFCRQRISAKGVADQSSAILDPAGTAERRRDGYAPGIEDPAPAVITFTTAIASSAVTELLQRLTGFMGTERESTEILHLFDQTSVRTNSRAGDPSCFCQETSRWGRGDVRPMLDLTWRPE